MTIDEAIKWVTEHFFTDGIVDCKQTAAVKTIADFYDWYREQDLIKRQDVLKVYNSDLCLDFDREMCESTPNCRCCNIMRIPKAEPPHATVDERNGDCETCKHYGDSRRETECDSCYEMDKYEPYIPYIPEGERAMNLIDRDKLKDEWENNYLVRNEMVDHNNMIDCVIVSIDAQPTVNEWIPVSERLPEEEGWYLTVVPNIHMNYYYMACKFDGKFPSDVIAWMPIPTYEATND